MSGAITMNGNIIYFDNGTHGAYVEYNSDNNILNIGNQNSRINFSSTVLEIQSIDDINLDCGSTNTVTTTGKFVAGGDITGTNFYGPGGAHTNVKIAAASTYSTYIELSPTTITLTATSWSTGSGTAAYITGNSSTGQKLVKYSSSRRYKENIDYEIDKEKYHEDLLKFKPCRFNYKTEPGLTNLGLIAEDVAEINPELCNFEDGKVESFKDRDLLVMCILELQRKDKEINELKSRLESLETRYNVEF